MATLRRSVSLDCTPHVSSNPGNPHCRLIRHSSLPNLFFCQPELSMRALSRPPCLYKMSSFSMDSPSFHSFSPISKLPLCRAVSNHSLDLEPPDFNIAAADARNCFSPPTTACAGHSSRIVCTAARKESIGFQSIDLEQSVVYTELRESMWKFEAPPRFFKPGDGDIEGKACGTHTHAYHNHNYTHTDTCTHHDATKPFENKKQETQDPAFSMKSSSDDVKGRPLSLRMLKRKLSKGTPHVASSKPCKLTVNDLSQSPMNRHDKPQIFTDVNCHGKPQVFPDVGDSVSSAFASLVYMMRMLQHYTYSLRVRFHARTNESDESCSHEAASVSSAYAEMLDSFLWLFQQVFSCTPKLMLLTMILLADFTLYSMSRHVAFPVMPMGEPPTATITPFNVEKFTMMQGVATDVHEDTDFVMSTNHGSEEKCKIGISSSKRGEELLHDGGDGKGGHVRFTRLGGMDMNGDGARPLQSRLTTEGRALVSGDGTHALPSSSAPLPASTSLHHVHEKLNHYTSSNKGSDLDLKTKRMLVAPVYAPALEADNYPCFDRTHLTYQHEINMDPTNPLLLANYAHFLHVVRHDHGRAEELYRRAVRADAEVDGEVMGRFASFLWVAKGDVAEADWAYKAAVAADPTNAFHAGCYAHFLWNSSASQAEETPCCIINNENADGDGGGGCNNMNINSHSQHIPT